MSKERYLVINKRENNMLDAVVVDRSFIHSEDAVEKIANYIRNTSAGPVIKPYRMEMARNNVYVTFTGDPNYCMVNWLFKFSMSLYSIRDMMNEHKEKCIAFYIPTDLDNAVLAEMKNEISRVFRVKAEEVTVEVKNEFKFNSFNC